MPKNSRADTVARLSHIEHLLYQHGEQGMKLEKLAEICEVSKRAIQRDLKLIEEEDIFPLWRDSGSCGIVLNRYLPPIRFEPSQALNIFLAARLMATYAHRNDPDITAIFTKLNCVVQPPLKEQVEKTIAWMKTLPSNGKVVRTLNYLADAWSTGHTVKIKYRSVEANEAKERLVDPYFIQPAGHGHSSYVLAYCHLHKAIRTFKVDRIQAINITDETYIVPSDFDANKYLSSAWSIMVGENIITVKLKVAKSMVRFMEEIIWHSSQKFTKYPDGSALMTIEVSHTAELMNWILGWGDGVEVLEPASLREDVARKARAISTVYSNENGVL